jgi:cobalt/nickel transport protein
MIYHGVRFLTLVVFFTCFSFSTALAHFGAIIPSDNIVSGKDNKNITLEVKFIHPVEMDYMEMAKPKRFAVKTEKGITDLTDTLSKAEGNSPKQTDSFTFWKADYTFKRPGDHVFFVEPQPYWEPAEDLFIVHYAKVFVNAFGLEEGWDEPVGLETEIVPLTRPYGLWTGNVFSGVVLLEGKPAPGAEVEVEYLNETPGNVSLVHPPADPYITQVVKADENGVFSYAMPKGGWWGFSALNEASWKLEHNGEKKGVEIGAVIWVKTIDIK